jgi:hypothetical protein
LTFITSNIQREPEFALDASAASVRRFDENDIDVAEMKISTRLCPHL